MPHRLPRITRGSSCRMGAHPFRETQAFRLSTEIEMPGPIVELIETFFM